MFDIVFNPVSGNGKSQKAFNEVVKELDKRGVEYKVHKTEYKGHASEIVRALNKEQAQTNVIAMGGDGTFNEVLNGIENFETLNLGLIPCGSGNDFMKIAHIPAEPLKALENILDNKADYVDFLQLDDRRCLNVAGVGMDVDVLVRFDTIKAFRGKMRYYAALIDTLVHLKFHKVELTINGETKQKSVFLICVANGKFIGNGMPISPNSDITDGKLNVVCVNEIKKRRVLGALVKFLKGKHIDCPYTENYIADEVTVKVLDDGKMQVDGEVFDCKTLHAKLITKTLKVFLK